jgi:hypothetical protein
MERKERQKVCLSPRLWVFPFSFGFLLVIRFGIMDIVRFSLVVKLWLELGWSLAADMT